MQIQKGRPAGGAAYDNARSHDSPIDRILHRLERVRRTGPGKWIAL